MTFAWFTFVAGIVIGVVIGYFISSSRLETKFVTGVSGLKDELGDLRSEVGNLKMSLLRSEEEREKLARFNVLIPEIIRKLTTNVFSDDIPFIAVRAMKNFFNAGMVAFFLKETDDLYLLKMGTGYPAELNGTLRIKLGEGIVGVALEHRKTLNGDDYKNLERYSRVTISEFERKGLKADLVAPIMGVEGIYGAIAVADVAFQVPEEKRYISMIGDMIALSYDKARIFFEAGLDDVKDELCDVYSKNYFVQRFVWELKKAENYMLPLSLLMLQIDGHKGLKGTFGREAGEVAVKNIAELARENTRRGDFVARFDDDRFVVVMVASTKEQAYIHGTRLCNTIGDMSFPISDRDDGAAITVSGGVAAYQIDGEQPADLIEAAEEALEVAKSRGGNRVEKSEAHTGSDTR
jgi:diguanylate cyclase (GGDEF)-like protein